MVKVSTKVLLIIKKYRGVFYSQGLYRPMRGLKLIVDTGIRIQFVSVSLDIVSLR